MRRIKINKRGVTPIIAVILLMMMTVAAAGAAFFWIVRVQSTLTGGTEQHIDSVISSIGSIAEMRNVYFTEEAAANSGNMTFTVRNLGSIPFVLTNASTVMTLFDGSGTTICTNNWAHATMNAISGSGSGVELNPSDTALITLNLTGDCYNNLPGSGELIRYDVDFVGDATAGGSFEK